MTTTSLETYEAIRAGIPFGVKPWDWILDCQEKIIAISAAQAQVALETRGMLKQPLYRMTDQFLQELMLCYDSNANNFKPGTEATVKQLVNYRSGELEREYLADFVTVAGLSELGNTSISIIQAIGFQFFVDFAKSRLQEAEQLEVGWNHEKILSIATQETAGIGEYQRTIMAKISHTLNQDRAVTAKERKVATAALYQANLMWQFAKVCQFASESSVPGTHSQRLNDSDFASFDDMVEAVYHSHKIGDTTADAVTGVLTTAFKLFQDAAEYLV